MGLAILLLLLLTAGAFIVVSSFIGALLLRYVTGMPRLSAFFSTLLQTASWTLFVIVGLEALFSSVMCHFSSIFFWCYGCSGSPCPFQLGTALFLHSTRITLFGLGVAVTVIQWLVVRDHYRLDDWLLLCILALSSIGGCVAWFSCLKWSSGWLLL